MSVETWAGLPLGDWATFAGAFAAFAAFVVVIMGLFIEGSRRRSDIARLDEQRHQDQISSQARLVGAYLSVSDVPIPPLRGGLEMVQVNVHILNRSELPIRRIQGHLTSSGRDAVTTRTESVPAMDPGETKALHIQMTKQDYALRLEFDDDSGVTWSKYGAGGLRQIEERSPEEISVSDFPEQSSGLKAYFRGIGQAIRWW